MQTKQGTYKGLIIEPKIQHFFAGRIWSRTNTPFPQQKIEAYIKAGLFTVQPAVVQRENKLYCNRCHNDKQPQFVTFRCARCEGLCHYCRHCITMGRMVSCEELITWNGPQPRRQLRHDFSWSGQFTNQQQQAAKELAGSIQQGRNHLLRAVCGAGKTEILFQAIIGALRKGLRVCVATPRTDVVLELYPRFLQVFPKTTIHALYGGAKPDAQFAQLVLATTHQLYRFEQAFDVMIVDEADAFPYTMDAALQKAVLKAKKQQAPIGYVTATPSADLLTRYQKEQWGYSFIKRRYHGHDLPVPRTESSWNYEKAIRKGKIPEKLVRWLTEKLARNEQVLLFFPTIDLLEVAISLFQQLEPLMEGVHAEDPERKEKVLRLRNGELKGLLTTTILERGITIKNVQVAVIGAEQTIFTASALIQISGRVGRNADFPAGDIVFFHHGLTAEMDEAIDEISLMNRGSE
ncbi:MAG: DEAD/DEAH box helicase family protein [Solibacillus sp.]